VPAVSNRRSAPWLAGGWSLSSRRGPPAVGQRDGRPTARPAAPHVLAELANRTTRVRLCRQA